MISGIARASFQLKLGIMTRTNEENGQTTLNCVCMERFSHIVVAVGVLRFLGVCYINLLGSLERMVIARHIGHDSSLVGLWCVDQICV